MCDTEPLMGKCPPHHVKYKIGRRKCCMSFASGLARGEKMTMIITEMFRLQQQVTTMSPGDPRIPNIEGKIRKLARMAEKEGAADYKFTKNDIRAVQHALSKMDGSSSAGWSLADVKKHLLTSKGALLLFTLLLASDTATNTISTFAYDVSASLRDLLKRHTHRLVLKGLKNLGRIIVSMGQPFTYSNDSTVFRWFMDIINRK